MPNSFYATDGQLGVNLAGTWTTATAFPLGSERIGSNGGRWKYVISSGAITSCDVVHIDTGGVAVQISSANVFNAGQIGVAMSSAAASRTCGWVALDGSGLRVNVLTGCAANVPLYTTDNAGVLDDATASLSHFQIQGWILGASNSAAATANQVLAIAQGGVIRRPAV